MCLNPAYKRHLEIIEHQILLRYDFFVSKSLAVSLYICISHTFICYVICLCLCLVTFMCVCFCHWFWLWQDYSYHSLVQISTWKILLPYLYWPFTNMKSKCFSISISKLKNILHMSVQINQTSVTSSLIFISCLNYVHFVVIFLVFFYHQVALVIQLLRCASVIFCSLRT